MGVSVVVAADAAIANAHYRLGRHRSTPYKNQAQGDFFCRGPGRKRQQVNCAWAIVN